MIITYIGLFLVSCIALSWLGTRLVKSLIEIAEYLHLREFIVGFFVMAIAACLPNLFVDISAALHNIPQLSFGDVLGGNIVDLTLVMALAVFFSRSGLPAESKMVQSSALFTSAAAVLPLLLILDGKLTRLDGVILILAFIFYSIWLFSKEDRFKKVYTERKIKNIKNRMGFLRNILKSALLLGLLILSSQGIIMAAQYFSSTLTIPISVIGLLIVGLGNCFPETYFSILSARKDQTWMILGNIMGSIAICATLVLGIVVLISPFQIANLAPFHIAMVFTFVAAIISLVIIRSGTNITKREGMILLAVYVAFLLSEVFLSR